MKVIIVCLLSLMLQACLTGDFSTTGAFDRLHATYIGKSKADLIGIEGLPEDTITLDSNTIIYQYSTHREMKTGGYYKSDSYGSSSYYDKYSRGKNNGYSAYAGGTTYGYVPEGVNNYDCIIRYTLTNNIITAVNRSGNSCISPLF